MKLNKYIGMAALAVAFTACQDDTLEGGKQQHGIYTLSGKMAGGAAMSRAQIELGNQDPSKESFMWNEGDAFTVYQNDGSYNWREQSVFTIQDYSETETADKKNATFSTDTPAEQGSYVALYPAGNAMDGNQIHFNLSNEVDFSEGQDTNKVWSDYFRKNMLMAAEGTLTEGDNTVSFQHLMSLVRVTYTNESGSDQSINQILLSTEGGSVGFFHEPYIDLNDGAYNIYGETTPVYQLTTNGLTVKAGDTFDFYILFRSAGYYYGDVLEIQFLFGNQPRTFRMPTSTIAAANDDYYGFEAGKRYWFNLTDDGDQLILSKFFTGESVKIDNMELAATLQKYLGADKVVLDKDGCGLMLQDDVDQVTELVFWGKEYTMTSLKGIEIFTNLERLVCVENGLNIADLSQLHQLEELYLSMTPLKEYDISSQVDLKKLTLEICRLQGELDLSAFTNLDELNVSGNDGLASIVLPNVSTLKKLSLAGLSSWASDSIIAEVCKKYPNLESLNVHNDGLTSLDVSGLPNLTELMCFDNHLQTTLDVSHLQNLKKLECGHSHYFDNHLMTVKMNEDQLKLWKEEWSGFSGNKRVLIDGDSSSAEGIKFTNKGFAVALSKDVNLQGMVTLYADSIAVMLEDDVLATTRLDFGYNLNKMSTLEGIEYFKNLTYFNCNGAGLLEADFSKNTLLDYIHIVENPNLTKVNLEGCNNLKCISVQNCDNLASLSIPNPGILEALYYGHTQVTFTKEQLEEFTSVNTLGCAGRFSDTGVLDLPAAMKARLVYLECQNNNLTSMNLSEYKSLQRLECYENNLTSLDVTPVKDVLGNLRCFSNQIKTLDVSSLTNLWNLECGIQDNGINLILTVNDAQQETWRNEWSGIWSNEKAYLPGDEIPVTIPNGSGSIGNFGEGGEF